MGHTTITHLTESGAGAWDPVWHHLSQIYIGSHLGLGQAIQDPYILLTAIQLQQLMCSAWMS